MKSINNILRYRQLYCDIKTFVILTGDKFINTATTVVCSIRSELKETLLFHIKFSEIKFTEPLHSIPILLSMKKTLKTPNEKTLKAEKGIISLKCISKD